MWLCGQRLELTEMNGISGAPRAAQSAGAMLPPPRMGRSLHIPPPHATGESLELGVRLSSRPLPHLQGHEQAKSCSSSFLCGPQAKNIFDVFLNGCKDWKKNNVL